MESYKIYAWNVLTESPVNPCYFHLSQLLVNSINQHCGLPQAMSLLAASSHSAPYIFFVALISSNFRRGRKIAVCGICNLKFCGFVQHTF